jgi:hypothetical protein
MSGYLISIIFLDGWPRWDLDRVKQEKYSVMTSGYILFSRVGTGVALTESQKGTENLNPKKGEPV